MRIKILTKNPIDDKNILNANHFSIVDKNETHLLINCSDNMIIGKNNSEMKPINPREVLFVESYGNDVFCQTINQKYKINSRLYEYEEKYRDLGFIQINKSYVLNINYITTIYPLLNMRYIVRLTNDEELIVTRTYLKSFKERIKGGTHGIL